MANLPAAKKSIRKDKKRRLRNMALRSELKTLIKKLEGLISSNQAEQAKKAFSVVMSKIDKAAKRDIIKRHNADRKKSRLSLKLSKCCTNKVEP